MGLLPDLALPLSSYALSDASVSLHVYSKSLLSSFPSPSALPPSFPLSSDSLSVPFTPPPSQPTSSSPYLLSSSSVLLRSLPEYVRGFAAYAHALHSCVEFLDQLTRRAHSAVRLLTSIQSSLPPLHAYAAHLVASTSATVDDLSAAFAEKRLRWQAALAAVDGELDALRGARVGDSGALSDFVDAALTRSKCAFARKEMDRFEGRLMDLRARLGAVEGHVALVRPWRSGEDDEGEMVASEADHQRWIDGWADNRRECVAWMADVTTHRNDAQSFVAHVNALLAPSSASSPSLSSIEADARARIDVLEQLSRTDRDERLPAVRGIVAAYQREAESLLEWSGRSMAWYASAMRVAGDIEREVDGIKGSAVMAAEYLRALEHTMAAVERIVRLRSSWDHAITETARRRRRARRRRAAVERVVQQWTEEDAAERDRRRSFWRDHGVTLQGTLPPALFRGLKNETGWVKVELKDDEALLPPVTDQDVEDARARITEKMVDEAKEGRQHEDAEEEDETLLDRVRRLEVENARLKLSLAAARPPEPAEAAPPSAVVSPLPSPSPSTTVERRLYDEALVSVASLEEALAATQALVDKEHLDSRELAVKLVSAKRALKKAEEHRDRLQAEVDDVRQRSAVKVSILDISINDMVLAERGANGEYRVRTLDHDRVVVLSPDSVQAVKQRAVAGASAAVLPEWVVGHVILMQTREARGKDRVMLGVKEGDEYVSITVALLDVTLGRAFEGAAVDPADQKAAHLDSSSSPPSSAASPSTASPADLTLLITP